MSELAQQTCVPCQGGVPPLGQDKIDALLVQLNDWTVSNGHHLSKTITFPDFKTALSFVNHIGDIAEEQGHHPDIYLSWGQVKLDVWTHKIDGLTESDFVYAAKVDQVSRD